MKKTAPDYPCCLVLPYRVAVYYDRYSRDDPYMTDSGRVYVEMTTNQLAILDTEPVGGQEYEKIRAFVKQRAIDGLKKDMTRAIERHEGIGDSAGWLSPLTPGGNMFAMLDSIKAVLRGTPAQWRGRGRTE